MPSNVDGLEDNRVGDGMPAKNETIVSVR